jgi:nucleotide-binding universal stress UspA family protein
MQSLLVPVDHSDASQCVIEKARELAEELPARVVLLYVDEPEVAYVGFGETDNLFVVSWPLETPRRMSKLQARMNALAAPLKAAGIEVETVVVVGLVLDDILELAEKYHPDYIVMGSRGHLSTKHLFTGNVFVGILKRLTCPMIVVPVERC